MGKQKLKVGALNRKEKAQIDELLEAGLPAEMIAERMSRSLRLVKEHLEKAPIKAKVVQKAEDFRAAKIESQETLRTTERWKNLKLEFDEEELKYFEESYASLMSQFKGDVLPSEEMQIFQAIKFELLMSRNLKERKRVRDEINTLEDEQHELAKEFRGRELLMSEQQKVRALQLMDAIATAKSIEANKTNEYTKLQERLDSLMKSLKAVRDQRLDKVENSKVSYLSLIKALAERDIQEEKMRHAELMKAAGMKEYKRLGQPVKFEDGNEDSVILSCDTVDALASPEEDCK